MCCARKGVFRDFPNCGGYFWTSRQAPSMPPPPASRLSHVQPLRLVLPLGPATGELT